MWYLRCLCILIVVYLLLDLRLVESLGDNVEDHSDHSDASCDGEDNSNSAGNLLPKSPASTKKRVRTPSAMAPELYKEVVVALQNNHRGCTKESKEKNKQWHKVARFLRKWPSVQLMKVSNPLSGDKVEERIVIPAADNPARFLIILRTDEIDDALSKYYIETIGDGAKKLSYRIKKVFVGLNERNIQKWLNGREAVQKNKPLFTNRAPLIPIKAKAVMERNQVDLVDMTNLADRCIGVRYEHILSVIDVFSRFLFLRPLQSKRSEEIADILETLYNTMGPPQIIQSDQGPEFKGAVKHLMSRLGVKIIQSAPYKPQSQGKSERSHPTWKSKLRLQLEELCNEDVDFEWSDSLETVTRLYNEGYHSSLGMPPFEVFFGRKSNRELNMLSVGQHLAPEDIEVEMEELIEEDLMEDDILFSSADGDAIERFANTVEQTRKKAKNKSEAVDAQMVARNVRKNPPSSYDVGETVFLRVKQKGGVKRGGNPLSRPLVYKAAITDVNRETYRYKVSYTDYNGQNKTEQVSVNDITSLTRADEQRRQIMAKKKANRSSSCMCTDGKCKRRPSDKCRYKMNFVCCKREGRGCKFHGLLPKTVDKKRTQKYNLSSTDDLVRVLADFAKDIRLAMKLSGDDNHKNLDNNIADSGLQYREPRTPGDGNCMFHAIADQLRMTGTSDIDHQLLRSQLVDYLETNQHTEDGTHMQSWIAYTDWETYLQNMRQDRVWGDELMLIAASNMFNVQITIISSLPGDSIRILTPSGMDGRNIQTILLGHLAEQHYYSLQTVEPSETSASERPKLPKQAKKRVQHQTKRIDGESKKKKKATTQDETAKAEEERISTLVNEAPTMVRADVIARMEVNNIGDYNEDFMSDGHLEEGHVLLGIDDESRYWASRRKKTVPIRNNHYYITDMQLAMFLNFRDSQRQIDEQAKVKPIYIDIVLIFWLFSTGKMNLLKKLRDGSFLYLTEINANRFADFKDALYEEWKKSQGDD